MIDKVKKYGHLTPLVKVLGRGAGKGAVWLLHCDCGSNVEKDITQVRKGRITTCGNCQYSRRLTAISRTEGLSLRKAERLLYARHIRKITERHEESTLSPSQVTEITGSNCYCCDSPSKHTAKQPNLNRNRIGRFIESDPYTFSGCIPLCPECHRMKGSLNLLDFLYKVLSISEQIEKISLQSK